MSFSRLAHSYHSILREPRTKQAAWVSPQILAFKIHVLQTEKVSVEWEVDFFCQWINVTNEKEVCLFSERLEKNAERTSFYFYCRGSVNPEACKTTKNKILLENKKWTHLEIRAPTCCSEVVWGNGAPHQRFFGREKWSLVLGNGKPSAELVHGWRLDRWEINDHRAWELHL